MRLNTPTLVVVCTGLLSFTVPAVESTGGLSDSRLRLESNIGRNARHYPRPKKNKENDLVERDRSVFNRSEEPTLQPTQLTGGDGYSRLAERTHVGGQVMSEGNEHLGRNMSKTIEEAIAHAKLSHKASLKRGSTVQYVKAVRVPDHRRSEVEKRRQPKLLSAREPRRNGGRDDDSHRFVKPMVYDHFSDEKIPKGEFFERQKALRNNPFESPYEYDIDLHLLPSPFETQREVFESLPYQKKRKYHQESPTQDKKAKFSWHPREISESAYQPLWEMSPSARPSVKPLLTHLASGQTVPVTTFRPTIRSLDLALYANRKKNQGDRSRNMEENQERLVPELREETDVRGGRVFKQTPDDYAQDVKTHRLSHDYEHHLPPVMSPTPVYFPKSYRKVLEAIVQKERKKVNDNLKQPVNDNLRHPVDDNLRQPLNDNLREPVNDNLRHPVNDNLRQPLNDNLRQPVNDNPRHPVDDNLRQQLNDNLREPVNENLRHQVNDNLRQPLNDNLRQPVNDNIRQPVGLPVPENLEETYNSIEKDIIPDREPIFQDVRTHPVEAQYYSALEDEIRKSPFLTESVRLVSSDSFRDLVKQNKTNKKSKNKNKESTKLDTLSKSGNKSTRKRKIKNKQKLKNKGKNSTPTKSIAETNDTLYNETQKWQDYYRNLRNNSKFQNNDGQNNQLKSHNDYPISRNPSVSEGYYRNWNTVPRSFQYVPQQNTYQDLEFVPEEMESFTEFEASNEINSNQPSDPRHRNKGDRKSVKNYYATKNSKLPDVSQVHKNYYSSSFMEYPKSSEKYEAYENNSGMVHEYHNSHLFSALPYGYEEKVYQVPETDKKHEYLENEDHFKNKGLTYDNVRKFPNLQANSNNRKIVSKDYERYRPLRDDFYDYYKMYDDYPDQYYDYVSSYYEDVPAKDDSYWDYSYPVKGLLSPLYLPRMSKTETEEKYSYKPHLNVHSIDEQYNFKGDTQKLDIAQRSQFSSTRNEEHPSTSSAPIRKESKSTFIPKTNEPQILVMRHSEQHRTKGDEGEVETIENKKQLSEVDSSFYETDLQEADIFTSAKPLRIPDVSTESKLISSVLARSSILRSMASSAKPQQNPSEIPKKTKNQIKSSLRDPVRRSPIPRLLWKGREIPRHPISPKLKPEDISYGWYPIPSPFPQTGTVSTKKNTVIFPSMPFDNL